MKKQAKYMIQNKANESPLCIAIKLAEIQCFSRESPNDTALSIVVKYSSDLSELRKIIETKAHI